MSCISAGAWVAASTRDAACTGELRVLLGLQLVMELEEENSDEEAEEAGELNMSCPGSSCEKLRCRTFCTAPYIYARSQRQSTSDCAVDPDRAEMSQGPLRGNGLFS